MRSGFLPAILVGCCSVLAIPAAAQDIDTLVTTTNRNPSTVADQISDPAERAAFLNLYKLQDPGQMLLASKSPFFRVSRNRHFSRRRLKLPPTAVSTCTTIPAGSTTLASRSCTSRRIPSYSLR